MSTVAVAVKSYLVGTSGVLAPLLTGVKVGYSPDRDNPREEVYGGSITGPVELAGFQPAGGRMRRKEELTLLLHIRVYKPGQKNTEASDLRAAEIGGVIGAYIAANPRLGGIDGLMKAYVSGIDLSEGWTDDDGAGSTLTVAIGLTTFLT